MIYVHHNKLPPPYEFLIQNIEFFPLTYRWWISRITINLIPNIYVREKLKLTPNNSGMQGKLNNLNKIHKFNLVSY